MTSSRLPSLPPTAGSRTLRSRLVWALAAAPVVVLTGPRGAGKSALISTTPELEEWVRRDLAELSVREWAQRDPRDFLRSEDPLIVENIHRAPHLLTLIRGRVDEEGRRPGQYLITAQVRLRDELKDPDQLGGRATFLYLGPATPREKRGDPDSSPWATFFQNPCERWGSEMEWMTGDPRSWMDRVTEAGYTGGAAARSRRLEVILQEDLPTRQGVERPEKLLALLRAGARESGTLLNRTALARSAGVERPTAHRHLELLHRLYLFHLIPPYSPVGESRPVRAPRIHLVDPGLGCDEGEPSPPPSRMAALALTDLLAWRHGERWPPQIHHWATHGGASTTFVLELNGRFLPLVVTHEGTATERQIRHLEGFRSRHPSAVPGGLVLHGGKGMERLSSWVWGAPLMHLL